MTVGVHRGEARQIKSVRAEQLAVWQLEVSLLADVGPGLLLVINVQFVDISYREFSGVELKVMEYTELLESRGHKRGRSEHLLPMVRDVVPAIVFRDGHQLVN